MKNKNNVITIIGGGITGITLALTLLYYHKDEIIINLIESRNLFSINSKNIYFSNNENQVIVLSDGSCRYLKRIGIWPFIEKTLTPIRNIEFITSSIFSNIHILGYKYNVSTHLGYTIYLNTLISILLEIIKNEKKIFVYSPVNIIRIQRNKLYNIVFLNDGTEIKSTLLIGADGSNSLVRKLFSIPVYKKNYEQIAVISTISTTVQHDNTAFEYLTNYGSLALLPMSNMNNYSIVWCIFNKYQNMMIKYSTLEFRQKIQDIIGNRLGIVTFISSRSLCSLSFSKAERNISHRMVLIGNAYQTIHPIGAQGFNLIFRDIMILSGIIFDSFQKKEDLGDYSVLLRYYNKRILDHMNILKLVNKLLWIFKDNSLYFKLIRNISLVGLRYMPFLYMNYILIMLG